MNESATSNTTTNLTNDKNNIPVRAIAWHPSRPTEVLIPCTEYGGTPQVHTLHADEGTGCSPPEFQALLRLLQAYEDFQTKSSKVQTESVKDLFRQYRIAISECVDAWQERLEPASNDQDEDDDGMNTDDKNDDMLDADQRRQETTELDTLKLDYAVLHLSDIFLPLLPTTKLPVSSFLDLKDPYAVPGLTTADTIRYLRYNHLSELDVEYPEYDAMLQATQPEKFADGLFWIVLTKLVLRGCLEEAWKVLSKHSLYQAVQAMRSQSSRSSVDPQYVQRMQETEHAFLILRDLFLLAPLPGGRTHIHDNTLEPVEAIDDTTTVMVLDDLHVQPLDYQCWEPKLDDTTSADVPLDFQAHLAQRKHRVWQDYLKQAKLRSFVVRHIPEVESLLDILTGKIPSTCDSWHESLLAELLYWQPSMKPHHLSRRARTIAEDFSQEQGGGLTHVENTLLNIMEGNASDALQLLFVFGAGSGAALPSTLMALLCCLFVESAILDESESDCMVDYLCEASAAIQSALSTTANHDVGAQLSIRLLLPYAYEAGARGERIRSTICEILEHHAPTTEGYTRSLIALIRPLIERKSLQVLDATCTVILSVYRLFMEEFNFDSAVLILLDGIELEQIILSHRELGSCYRTLARLCLETVENLTVFAATEDDGTRLADAAVVGEAIEAAISNSKVSKIPEVMMVSWWLELKKAFKEDDMKKAARTVVTALNDDVDGQTGVNVVRNLHWYLLRVAHYILARDIPHCFDTRGIQRLMEVFLQLNELPGDRPVDQDSITEIESSLAHGLAHAFITENARKANLIKEPTSYDFNDTVSPEINSSNFHTYRVDVQERFVQQLLDS